MWHPNLYSSLWLFGRRPFAAAHDDYSSENHRCGEYFLPGKDIHTENDAQDRGDDWLYIAVHADKSRSYALLTVWNKEIADERSKYDEVSQLPQLC